MSNFIFALQATAHYIQAALAYVVLQQILWGFGLGFLASTGMHLIMLGDDLNRTTILLLKTPYKAFSLVGKRALNGTYVSSYHLFMQEYLNIHSLFYYITLTFLIIVVISLLWY